MEVTGYPKVNSVYCPLTNIKSHLTVTCTCILYFRVTLLLTMATICYKNSCLFSVCSCNCLLHKVHWDDLTTFEIFQSSDERKYTERHLGRVAPTWFMISVLLNLDHRWSEIWTKFKQHCVAPTWTRFTWRWISWSTIWTVVIYENDADWLEARHAHVTSHGRYMYFFAVGLILVA